MTINIANHAESERSAPNIKPRPLQPLCGHRLPLSWDVGHHADKNLIPLRWVPAQVPGAVQLDWARAEGWPDYWKESHFRDYEWMEDVYWTYRARLNVPVLAASEKLVFVCRGIDYRFQVHLGETLLHEQEGMFTPFEIDLTDRFRLGDELTIVVYPAPKSKPSPADRSQADHSCKPAVSYGWDFHPRLIPLGIWDETYLEIRPALHLADANVEYHLASDFSKAYLTLHLTRASYTEGLVRWSLYKPDGSSCFEQEISFSSPQPISQEILSPALWWPHDQGEPALHMSLVELLGTDGGVVQSFHQRIGFRQIRLVMNEGAWLQPSLFPKTRSNPPITLEINGRPLFCKGSNWVNPSIFPGTINDETYRPLLRLVREAHFNLLRCWGGGLVNKEGFFDLCDELGIMVWQEFPLACNHYPDDPAYLRILDQESKSIIRRLKPHPSVVIWCGGNELFNVWSGMTDQSLPLRLLNRNCFDLDPERPFLPTSPVMGMGHGHYIFRDSVTGQEAFEMFQKATNTAYTEFGMSGPAPVEVLQSFLPPDELFPPRRNTNWETHHAFGVWLDASHLYLESIEYYCGPSATLEELVDKGQFLQSAGYQGLFEEARRQKPFASMALNWCFNEPWPAAANSSLVSWPARPKPAYAAVKQSCRPILASARIRKFLWREGEIFDPEIGLLSDSPLPFKGGTMEVLVELGDETTKLLSWDFPPSAPNTNQPGPRLYYRLPGVETNRLKLRLRVVGNPEWDSEYGLVYARSAVQGSDSTLARPMNL